MSPSFGVVYVATKKMTYLEEAALSARSIKAKASLPVTLFTNLTDSPLCGRDCFDEVVPIETCTEYASDWASGQLDRIRCLSRSPYQLTLHIDADTFCLSEEVAQLPDLLEGHDIGLTVADPQRSISARHYARPMFYTGMMMYALTEKVKQLLAAWEQASIANFAAASQDAEGTVEALHHVHDAALRRKLAFMDQISLLPLLSPETNPLGLNVKVLDESWNYTGVFDAERQPSIKIYAMRPPKPLVEALRDHYRQGRFEQGVEANQRLLQQFPWDPDLLTMLAGCLLESGNRAAAAPLLERAIDTFPYREHYFDMLFQAYVNLKQPQQAQKVAETALEYFPDKSLLLLDLSKLCRQQGDLAGAVEYGRRAIDKVPEHHMGYINLALALIEQRHPDEAQRVCEAAMQRFPNRMNNILSVLQMAFGDQRAAEPYARLVDYDQFLQSGRITPPAPYATNAEFNQALCGHVLAHPTLEWEPEKHYTEHGSHTKRLDHDEAAVIAALNTTLDSYVRSYMESLRALSDHPWLRTMPAEFEVKVWAVVMQQEGRQMSHIHPEAWCSGVYYAEIPDSVRPDDDSRQGWIEFGRPRELYSYDVEPQTKSVCPEPGLLVIFPSYFWHETIPLKSTERRICLAFDVVPVNTQSRQAPPRPRQASQPSEPRPAGPTSSSRQETAQAVLDKWSIGIYHGTSPIALEPHPEVTNPVLTRHDVTDVPALFVADPFMLRADDEWAMFFEVLNAQTGKGEIGLATSRDGLRWRYRRIVIAEPFHLSYPHAFAHDGDYYMVAETIGAEATMLYRADSFPEKWSCVGRLLEGVALADPTIVYFHEKWWLFGCTRPRQHDNLRLYFADDMLGPWLEHPASPIVEGQRDKARAAGRIVTIDGRLIRFAQDCGQQYGEAVRAFEITTLSPTDYQERPCADGPVLRASGSGWNAAGMHHIDAHAIESNEWLACVDGKAFVRNPATGTDRVKVAEAKPGILNFRKNSWPLDEDRCPCDVHFLDYLRQHVADPGKCIFHFGSGEHHVVGIECSGMGHEVISITASRREYDAYVDLIMNRPKIANHYKALFGDIYTLSPNSLPSFDLVTLFHLCEYYDKVRSAYARLDDRSLVELFLDKLKPDGRILFYRGSVGFAKAKEVIAALVDDGKMRVVGEFKSLLIGERGA